MVVGKGLRTISWPLATTSFSAFSKVDVACFKLPKQENS
jgi:hypothetical protein